MENKYNFKNTNIYKEKNQNMKKKNKTKQNKSNLIKLNMMYMVHTHDNRVWDVGINSVKKNDQTTGKQYID